MIQHQDYQILCSLFSNGLVLVDLKVDAGTDPGTAADKLVERERKEKLDDSSDDTDDGDLDLDERDREMLLAALDD